MNGRESSVGHYHLVVTERSFDADTDSLDERTVDVASAALDQVTEWAEGLRGRMQLGGFEVTPASGYHASTSRWPGYTASLTDEHRKFFLPKWHEQIVLSTVVVEIHECASHTCELSSDANPEFRLAELPQSELPVLSRTS